MLLDDISIQNKGDWSSLWAFLQLTADCVLTGWLPYRIPHSALPRQVTVRPPQTEVRCSKASMNRAY
ncbi:hypothetical protein SRHO_G00240330 [Serrasalmus rhombeus]